ncbi:MAG: hypothetical protein JXB07_01365 [Anaerolineae bacterium]|nr:hypothetical protein [Anaerolineae bacterium]
MTFRITAVTLMLALAVSACTSAPGSQKRIDVSFTIFAYADADGNGKHDSGEQAIPLVLVITDSNIHGSLTRSVHRTGANGEALINGTYTHYFSVKVVPPCGYTPTTSNTFATSDLKGKLPVGFTPDNPQPGDAVVRFHVWNDANQNGIQDDGEEPIDARTLLLDIFVPGELSTTFGADIGHFSDAEMAVTLNDGRGQFSLGNSCGTLRVLLPKTEQWEPMSISPAPEFEAFSSGMGVRLRFEYAPGETDIEIGVTAGNE